MTKLSRVLLAIVVMSMLIVSVGCNAAHPVNQNNNTQEKNSPVKKEDTTPQYVKDLSSFLSKEGIKVEYSPSVTFNDMPQPSKPYTLPIKRNIPEEWVAGKLKWKCPVPEAFSDNYNYILGQSTKNKVFVLNLYRRKNMNSPFPKEITYSDYILIKTLDKAPKNGPMPQNQEAIMSKDFVVWNASSNSNCSDWTTWAYDINTGETFKVISYKECSAGPLFYTFFPDNPDKIMSNYTEYKNGKPIRSNIVIYDLKTRKLSTLLSSSKYDYLGTFEYANVVYSNRITFDEENLYQIPNWKCDLVAINLNNHSEKVLIPEKFNFEVNGVLNNTIALVAKPPNYPFIEIWMLDMKNKALTCYIRVRKFTKTDEYVTVTPPISTGFLYCITGKGKEAHYFYSYRDKRAVSVGPTIATDYHSGTFLVPQYEYDLFPLPPFNYPGKEERLKGYCTFLIIKPE